MTTATSGTASPLLSPLHDRHVALGAKMADFGGWDMPIEYPGEVSSPSTRRSVSGSASSTSATSARPRSRARAPPTSSTPASPTTSAHLPGSAQYTLCCDESGGVVDDLIAYLKSDDDVFLIPNAANTAEVVRRLEAAAPDGIEVTNLHDAYGVIAVQGTKSDEVLERSACPPGTTTCPSSRPNGRAARHRVPDGLHRRARLRARPAVGHTWPLWDALTEAHLAPFDGKPCGLGARDTLRTEMGYPLHGQDLSLDISPVQARAGWAVGWKKEAFWGKDALRRREGDPDPPQPRSARHRTGHPETALRRDQGRCPDR